MFPALLPRPAVSPAGASLASIFTRAVKRCCALAGASPAWEIVGAPQ
jgi:hypothetical protein